MNLRPQAQYVKRHTALLPKDTPSYGYGNGTNDADFLRLVRFPFAVTPGRWCHWVRRGKISCASVTLQHALKVLPGPWPFFRAGRGLKKVSVVERWPTTLHAYFPDIAMVLPLPPTASA